jgi:hypothetical protein
MMRLFIPVAVFFLSGIVCRAQLLQDRITGKYYFDIKSTDIKGSPYLYDEWRPSLITYANGLQLKNVPLKFDLYNHKPLFLRNDSIFEFVQDVWAFVIYNPGGDSVIFRNGFPAEGNISPATYLEVMEEGKLVLLRHQVKGKTETKGYGSATPVTEFSLAPSMLYLLQNNALRRLKKNDEEAMKIIMTRDWEMVSGYIKQKKLGLRKDEDIASIIHHYNGL